jgi:tRNA(Ile)-lysidine synthase TilS/MesJ
MIWLNAETQIQFIRAVMVTLDVHQKWFEGRRHCEHICHGVDFEPPIRITVEGDSGTYTVTLETSHSGNEVG